MFHPMHKITRTLNSKKFFVLISWWDVEIYFRADHRLQFGGSHVCVVTNKSTAALDNSNIRFTGEKSNTDLVSNLKSILRIIVKFRDENQSRCEVKIHQTVSIH